MMEPDNRVSVILFQFQCLIIRIIFIIFPFFFLKLRNYNQIQFFSIISDATWLSTNFGIIVCIECSGIHREMGVHISKIQSLTLDNIGTSQLLVARYMTNENFNKIMEAKATQKPNPSSTM